MSKRDDARSLTAEQKDVLRMKAVSMVMEHGYTQRADAKALGVSRKQVNRWCRKYEKRGWNALKAQPVGRKPLEQMQLQPWQCAVIVRMITDNTPDQLKLPFMLWSRAVVRDLIAEKFGITFALSIMSNYLRRWGFTAQKPVAKAIQQNPQAVKEWMEIEYPKIAKRAKAEGTKIFWGDETGVTNKVNNVRGFAPKGRTPVLLESGKRLTLNMISAVSNKGELCFMTYSTRMTQSKYLVSLARLIQNQSQGRKVFFIAGNLKVHRGKRLKAWAEEHKDQIELFFIPSYSPELNPDEYLNRDLKTNVHQKRRPTTQQQLKENLLHFMHKLQKMPERIRSYFHSEKLKYCAG